MPPPRACAPSPGTPATNHTLRRQGSKVQAQRAKVLPCYGHVANRNFFNFRKNGRNAHVIRRLQASVVRDVLTQRLLSFHLCTQKGRFDKFCETIWSRRKSKTRGGSGNAVSQSSVAMAPEPLNMWRHLPAAPGVTHVVLVDGVGGVLVRHALRALLEARHRVVVPPRPQHPSLVVLTTCGAASHSRQA